MKEKKVLVVDDECAIRGLLEMALNRAGYSVCSVSCAEEALDVLRQESFPLMFIDLSLGKVNGFELCKNIRKDDSSSIVYALTGNADLIAKAELDEVGFNGCIGKSVGIEKLYEVAKESFNKFEKIGLA
jgi:DNA-binding response OmpR family regulator